MQGFLVEKIVVMNKGVIILVVVIIIVIVAWYSYGTIQNNYTVQSKDNLTGLCYTGSGKETPCTGTFI